jgi:hypothetical protein
MTPPLTILGDVFRGVYRQTRPRRLAIVGCGAGHAIELVDPAITSEVIGVDALAQVDVTVGALDLLHLALVLEGTDPAAVMARAAGWLSPAGVCSVVLSRADEAIGALAERAGLFRTRSWDVAVPNDKGLHVGIFGKKRPWR